MLSARLLVINEATALAWVLAEQRMAFPAGRRSLAATLAVGDEVFIYATRGCFHNPGRDVGRIVSQATVGSTVRDMPEPVVFKDHSYTSSCELAIRGLAGFGHGLDMRLLVPELHAFPDPGSWALRLRTAALSLDEHDAALLRDQLAPLLRPLKRELPAYVQAAAPYLRSAKQLAVETAQSADPYRRVS
jgi:hypothetical protein